MASREKAVKCSGHRCKEVFHIFENYEPGGYNDSGYIAVKCKKCGEITLKSADKKISDIPRGGVQNFAGALTHLGAYSWLVTPSVCLYGHYSPLPHEG